MADDRYNRWQGLAIAQLSVAIALISGLSVAGLGIGVSLLQNDKFMPSSTLKCAFAWSMFLLLLAALLSCAAVITRLLDFRLTARKVRKDKNPEYEKPLILFQLGPDAYGRLTWGLFWLSSSFFLLGVILLVVFIAGAYAHRWH